jgi:hypothetical protein
MNSSHIASAVAGWPGCSSPPRVSGRCCFASLLPPAAPSLFLASCDGGVASPDSVIDITKTTQVDAGITGTIAGFALAVAILLIDHARSVSTPQVRNALEAAIFNFLAARSLRVSLLRSYLLKVAANCLRSVTERLWCS